MVHIAVSELECDESPFAASAVQFIQIIAGQLLESTRTRTVQNRHFAGTYHLRIVHVRDQGFGCLVHAHAAYI